MTAVINYSHKGSHLTLAHSNVRSVNKRDLLYQCIQDRDIDICAVAETWLKGTEVGCISCGSITQSYHDLTYHAHMKIIQLLFQILYNAKAPF